MPQAVQNPLTILPQSSYSASRTSSSKPSDGPSFQDTLDDIQNNEPKASKPDGPDQQKTEKAKPTSTNKTSKKAPAKKASGNAAAKSEKPGGKTAKDIDAEDPQDSDAQSSPDQQEADADPKQGDGKSTKKKAVEAAVVSPQPVDTVQLQNAAATAAPRAAAPQKAQSSDEQKGGKEAGKLQPKAIKTDEADSAKKHQPSDAPATQSESQAAPDSQPDQPDDAPAQSPPVLQGKKGKQALAIQPRKSVEPSNETDDAAAASSGAVALPQALQSIAAGDATQTDAPAAPVAARSTSHVSDSPLLKSMGTDGTSPGVVPKSADLRAAAMDSADPTAATSAAPETQFAEANHARIVTGIQGQLLPNGGSMHIRLDPPELGALHVKVEMRDGVMTASFETSNDHATRMLSHSLSDLKTALESQGVNVDKLQVRQSPKDQQTSSDNRQPDRSQDQARQQEQQRKEMVRRMWAKLMKGSDPLDLVA